jgi:Zn-dependent M16 (insulinase) family peptidase
VSSPPVAERPVTEKVVTPNKNATKIPNISISIHPDKGLNKKTPEEKEEKKSERNSSFTQEELIKNWMSFRQSMSADVHVLKSIEKCVPLLKTENLFELVVENSIQQKIVMDLKGDILPFLRDKLAHDNLDFTVSVEMTEINKPITSQDKLNEMLSKNEAFRKLATDLSLEI